MSWISAGNRWSGLAAAVVFVATTAPAYAEAFTFTIFKDADPIGHDTYLITAKGDEKTVQVETRTDVKVLFISYHYHHTRTEVWKGATLVSFVSDTDDDGTKHHVEAHQEGDKLTAIADGKHVSLPGNAMPFTLWTRQLMSANTPLFDIADFEPLKLQWVDKGKTVLSLDGHAIDTQHYQVTGDLQWDLWYGLDGNLVKTAFRRMGYPISFVRE
jgi:hypothetical protein